LRSARIPDSSCSSTTLVLVPQTPHWQGRASLGGWYVVRTGVCLRPRPPAEWRVVTSEGVWGMRRFSYSPLWLARSLVGLAHNPERPSSRGRDRPGLLLETPYRVPLRALMSGMLTAHNYLLVAEHQVRPPLQHFHHDQNIQIWSKHSVPRTAKIQQPHQRPAHHSGEIPRVPQT